MTVARTIVTLVDGTPVDSDSPEWRAECEARWRHVMTMGSLTTQGRRDYLERVAQAEGAESRRRLAEAYVRYRDAYREREQQALREQDQDPKAKP